MENNIEFNNSDFEEDQYSRLRLIPWWNQDRLKTATIMVVGAGAIGNELIKNLTLLGIGRILVFDMDDIENTNLTRSILYRRCDVGRYKAEVAVERAMEINPDVKAKAFVSNIIDDVGLGVFRRMDVVLGGLDNREARLHINQSCYHVNRPWIDGAIEALNGFARVFVPGHGACYECTMTRNRLDANQQAEIMCSAYARADERWKDSNYPNILFCDCWNSGTGNAEAAAFGPWSADIGWKRLCV